MTDYCTADQASQRLSPTGKEVSDVHSSDIARACTQSSRWIDRHIGDQFADASDEVSASTRQVPATDCYYDSRMGAWVAEIPWTSSVTTVYYDPGDAGTWTTLSASDYYTLPLDGWKNGQSGWPVEKLVFPSLGLRAHGRYPVVKVTAPFTWSARPGLVTDVAINVSRWIVQQRDTKGGFTSFGDVGFAQARSAGLFEPINFMARKWGTFLPGIA